MSAPDDLHGATEHADRAIAALAGRQHGVVTAAQLLEAGLSRRQIGRRLVCGTLHRVFDGVYFLGYVPRDPRARYMAATFAARGVASHRTAAALHGLWDHHRTPDVTSERRSRGCPGLRRHWTRTLPPADVTARFGIPATTLQRTLVDLADVLDHNPFEAVLRRAEATGMVDRLDLRPIHGRRGATRVVRAHQLTRSGAERAFRRAVRRAGLPPPEYNARWLGYEIDALWLAHRVAVEIDGFQHHRSREAFRADRRKGNSLAAAGIALLRFTYEDVVDRGERAIADVLALLSP